MQHEVNATEQNLATENMKLPYAAPTLIDYGSVRELTQEFSIHNAIVSVVATVV